MEDDGGWRMSNSHSCFYPSAVETVWNMAVVAFISLLVGFVNLCRWRETCTNHLSQGRLDLLPTMCAHQEEQMLSQKKTNKQKNHQESDIQPQAHSRFMLICIIFPLADNLCGQIPFVFCACAHTKPAVLSFTRLVTELVVSGSRRSSDIWREIHATVMVKRGSDMRSDCLTAISLCG